MEDFATRLRYFRTQKGVSQETLGNVVGKKSTTVSTWERGESEPSLDDVAKLAEFLGVSPARLAYGIIVETAPVPPLEGKQDDYRISGSSAASSPRSHPSKSDRMLTPSYQPRTEPSAEMCSQYFAEFLRRASEADGGLGFTWRMLHKKFPLDEFEPAKKEKS